MLRPAMSAGQLLCPQCGAPYEQGDFLCTSCELILDLDAAEANYRAKEPSIVRALISPPQRRSTGVRPAPPAPIQKKGDPDITVRGAVVMDQFTIPRLMAGMNLALTPLHEFEAMVCSFVDGASSVPQIATAAEISKVEAMAVFTSLAQRRIVELRRHEPPPPEPEPEPAPELEPEPPTPPPTPPPSEPRHAAPPPPLADFSAPRPALSRPPPVVTPARTTLPPRATPAPPPPLPSNRPPPAASSRPKPSQLQAPSQQAAVPKAESVLERAISLERRGEVDGAIHVLKRAIAQVKEPAALCNKLALILVNQRRDFHQAEELLNKAIELEPDNAVYQQNLFKVVGLAAERRENRSSTPSKGGGGFFSKLLKK